MQSILTNGWTMPIVIRPDYTIIDGFHRWTVSGREPLKTLLKNKVPVVIVDHNHNFENKSIPIGRQGYKTESVKIGLFQFINL